MSLGARAPRSDEVTGDEVRTLTRRSASGLSLEGEAFRSDFVTLTRRHFVT